MRSGEVVEVAAAELADRAAWCLRRVCTVAGQEPQPVCYARRQVEPVILCTVVFQVQMERLGESAGGEFQQP